MQLPDFFQQSLGHFQFPPAIYEINFSTFPLAFSAITFFYLAILIGYMVIPDVVSICISPMSNVLNIFSFAYLPSVCPFL